MIPHRRISSNILGSFRHRRYIIPCVGIKNRRVSRFFVVMKISITIIISTMTAEYGTHKIVVGRVHATKSVSAITPSFLSMI